MFFTPTIPGHVKTTFLTNFTVKVKLKVNNYPVPWKFLHDEKIRIRRIEITKVVENNFLKYVSKFRV